MNSHVIRTSETNSVKGIATKQYVDLNLKQTTKSLPFPNVSTTISQQSLYEKERQAGNKFRLILTIAPYCSNVLFNTLTEIVKNEGSGVVDDEKDDCIKVITDKTNIPTEKGGESVIIGETIGIDNPTRQEMISNTEYSSPKHGGYEYHPGYDFFDNHILRNKTFKVVNRLKTGASDSEKTVFNTLGDFDRRRDGQINKIAPRKGIDEVNKNQKFGVNKHLYLKTDILNIDESINQNLYEDNGWWGFLNNTTIDSKEYNNGIWSSLDISHVLNNHKSCEFIDMYPDRSLFSFVPKYNPFKQKNENNWNVVITYPYKNIYNHPICLGGGSYIKRSINRYNVQTEETITEGNKWTGLKVMKVNISTGGHGGTNVVFRTYTKHGLSKQDMFYVYYTNPYLGDEQYDINKVEKYYESEIPYKVTNIGDLSRNDNDYYFYISNTAFLRELYQSYLRYVVTIIDKNKNRDDDNKLEIPFKDLYDKDDKKDIFDDNGKIKDLLNQIVSKTNFRIRRSVSGCKSIYYLRLFRKLPNLNFAKRKMTDEEKLHTSKNNGLFDTYVKENASDPLDNKYQRLVNSEQYKMAFAKTIYNDSITQISFIEGVDIDGLTDNLGRPLTELYYTIIKNNSGYKEWYEESDYGSENIEYSHCFGKITSGLKMHFTKDDTEDSTVPHAYLKQLSSANHITNIKNNSTEDTAEVVEDNDTRNLDNDLTVNSTFFYGDLVEFNAYECEEHVLSNVMHRFNTAQRELLANSKYNKYYYHEIYTDDYDIQFDDDRKIKDVSFEAKEYKAVPNTADNDAATIARPEGYIYKAHYQIPIREYTSLQQGSNYTIRIRGAKPVQKNGILIEVSTMLAHNFNENDDILICDDERDIRYVTKCAGVIDKTRFLMYPQYYEIVTNATDFDDIETLCNLRINGNETDNVYNRRFNWIELCEILNGDYDDDISYPKLIIRRKNKDIPNYATYIGGNQYVWRNIVNIGDSLAQKLPNYIFANGYFYVTSTINFFLHRQDPFGNNGLFFDGEKNYPFFPNDPSGNLQKENNFITKDTSSEC